MAKGMPNLARKLTFTAPTLRLIMTDDNETTDTLVPETDRNERRTLPPGEADAEATRVAQTMLPAAPSGPALKLDADMLVINPQDMPSLLYNQLMRVHQQQLKRDEEMFEPEGRFAALQREQHRLLVLGFKEATAQALEPKIDELAQELRSFSERVTEKDTAQDERLAEGDKRFAAIERSIADLKDELLALVNRATADAAKRIDALESELAKARADAARPPETPASTTAK
jgi:hypothetical protein